MMGWSIGYDEKWKRDIGYGVPAFCDHPECNEQIDRGLAYVCCGEEPYGGEYGCGLYFCGKHHTGCVPTGEVDEDGEEVEDDNEYADCRHSSCERCAKGEQPFPAKPDHPEWIQHKATDPSWAEWRALQASA